MALMLETQRSYDSQVLLEKVEHVTGARREAMCHLFGVKDVNELKPEMDVGWYSGFRNMIIDSDLSDGRYWKHGDEYKEVEEY